MLLRISVGVFCHVIFQFQVIRSLVNDSYYWLLSWLRMEIAPCMTKNFISRCFSFYFLFFLLCKNNILDETTNMTFFMPERANIIRYLFWK